MGAGGRGVLQEEHLGAQLCVAAAHRRSIADAYAAFVGQVDQLPEDTYGLALYALERASRQGPAPLGLRKNLPRAPFVTNKAKHAAICNEAHKILAGLDGYERKVLPYCPQPLRQLQCRRPVPGQQYPPAKTSAASHVASRHHHPHQQQQQQQQQLHQAPVKAPCPAPTSSSATAAGCNKRAAQSVSKVHMPACPTQSAMTAEPSRHRAPARPRSAGLPRHAECSYNHVLLLPRPRHVSPHLRVAQYYLKDRPLSSPGMASHTVCPDGAGPHGTQPTGKACAPAACAQQPSQQSMCTASQQAMCRASQQPAKGAACPQPRQEPDVYPYRLPNANSGHQACMADDDDHIHHGVLLQLIKQHRRAVAQAVVSEQALDGACHAGRSKRVIPSDEQVAAARRLGIPVVELMDPCSNVQL